MPVTVTAQKGKVPYVNYDEDYYYIPVSIMWRTDIMQETKLCFSMAVTEYLPYGLEYAQKRLSEITISDIVCKFKQPIVIAEKIRDEIISLAPDLHSILKGK
ncbi:MAG: hypothetical protein K2I06_09950 [Ruminococcus sp.]|nr:hypothetical protein [Ruminococcus sp.]